MSKKPKKAEPSIEEEFKKLTDSMIEKYEFTLPNQEKILAFIKEVQRKERERCVEFLKKEEARARCERGRKTVEHCTCMDYAVNELLCQHKEKKLDYCPDCNESI